MLHYSVVFLVIALIAAVFGFGGIAAGAVEIAKILFFVFLVSGFWHGANWTFIIWGALNGFYLIFAILTKKWRGAFDKAIGLTRVPFLHKLVQVGTTFALCALAWIFFRANTVHDAFMVIKKIFTQPGPLFKDNDVFVYSFFGLLILFLMEVKQEYFNGKLPLFSEKSIYLRYAFYVALVVAIILMGVFDGGQFIYFQF